MTPPGESQPIERGTRRRGRSASGGQSLVELALIAPILIVWLLIAADFGRAFTSYIVVTSAAREGASFGSVSEENAEDAAAVRSAALAGNPTIWGSAPSVSSLVATDEFGYDYVEVTVDYEFSPLFPMPPIPETIDMSRTVRMRIVGN